MQLEFAFYSPYSVRAVLAEYTAMKAEKVAAETIDDDYRWRNKWLIEVFGEATPVTDVTFLKIEKAAREARGVLRDVTIKRRLVFYKAAVKYAAMRGVVPKDAIPDLPPWFKDDGVHCEDFYTFEQFVKFRLSLPPGKFRTYADLCFWTGQHDDDIRSMERWMLEPDFEWLGVDGEVAVRGRWWRRNQKNRRCKAIWIPMEPEFRDVAAVILQDPENLPLGKMNNLRRTFHAAAALVDLPPVRPNLGLRASHSTLLMARGYPYEYVRQVLGHEGEVSAEVIDGVVRAKTAKHASTLSRHYLRPSPELFVQNRGR